MNMAHKYPNTFEGLLQLVAHLRSPIGCPWDIEQSQESLKQYLLEECYELLDAIDKGCSDGIVDEIGDLLFNLAFQIQLKVEKQTTTSQKVFLSIIEKLKRRHPHVFGKERASNVQQVESNWSSIKRAEQTNEEAYFLSGVPKNMPALSYAQTLQQKASYTGFDWKNIQGVMEKIHEEVEELRESQSHEDKEQELGDLLFSIVNLGRWIGTDAESALRKASTRFRSRFDLMEKLSRKKGKSFDELSSDQKELLWETAKTILN